MESAQILGVFLTGLLAGGLSCIAVQGGLLAATIAQRHNNTVETTRPILAFLGAKLLAYTLLGFLLGWLGSAFQFALLIQVLLQIAVGLFMLGTALHLLKVHPVFRYFIIQPPYFITRFIRQETKSKSIFAPTVLGISTVFIPCGATQAVMALSILSGSPLAGAILLFAFTLGTSPLFFLIGYFTSRVTIATKQSFAKYAAFVLLAFALFNLNNASALTGSTMTIENLSRGAWCVFTFCEDAFAQPSNAAAIVISTSGYTPQQISVKAGQEISLRLTNQDSNNCAQAFTIPKLGVKQVVPLGSSQTIHFRAPKEPGQLSFMCSMGMYRGTIQVI